MVRIAAPFANNLTGACGEFLGGGGGVEGQLAVFSTDIRDIPRLDGAAENLLGHRVFKEALHRAAHRARAVLRVVAFLDEEVLRFFIEDNLDILQLYPRGDL